LVFTSSDRQKSDEIDYNCKDLYRLEAKEEHVEKLIFFSDAVAYPRTMMVKSCDTEVAVVTVLHSQRLVGLANPTVSLYAANFLKDGIVLGQL
jgi:hypothetical protein